jgi:dihydroxyacetone kinase-like predicted kinase
VLETAAAWGTLHDIKIDNMADQRLPSAVDSPARPALVAVAPGPGLAEMMRGLGADVVITAEANRNPAVADFVAAVERQPAAYHILLPNNANIVLAARQAQKILGGTVAVVATRGAPQGLAALLAFNPADSMAVNAGRMEACANVVRAAGVTTAVRDSTVAGQPVPAGHYIGVTDDEVIAAGTDLAEVLRTTIANLATTATEVISLYFGAGLDAAVAERLAAGIRLDFTNIQIELYFGGQPHYYFIIGVE